MCSFRYIVCAGKFTEVHMTTDTLPNFTNALLALGKTDDERASALGVPRRTFMDYKAARLPLGMRRLLQPSLLRALLADLDPSIDSPSSTTLIAKSCTPETASSIQN